MATIALRTVFGGPDPEVVGAVAHLKPVLRAIEPSYELDVFLHVGGDVTTTDAPSGLVAPRVSVAQRRMTAQIRVNAADLRGAVDLDGVLRRILHDAFAQMTRRIAAKDPTVDLDAELARFAPLTA